MPDEIQQEEQPVEAPIEEQAPVEQIQPELKPKIDAKIINIIGAAALGIAGVIAGYQTLNVSDTEIENYIQTAIANGCRPVIDVCESNCGKIKDYADFGVSEQCIQGGQVLRMNYKRANDGLLSLAKKLNVDLTQENMEQLPVKIREKLEVKGMAMQPVKESLILDIQDN
ncbi:MAG: hypothetical protein NTZ18_03685 [Candidatus Komeilibacteria bacterium]|nr:hypothetical protein [Candidatus Komeilibacteria bacterium]